MNETNDDAFTPKDDDHLDSGYSQDVGDEQHASTSQNVADEHHNPTSHNVTDGHHDGETNNRAADDHHNLDDHSDSQEASIKDYDLPKDDGEWHEDHDQKKGRFGGMEESSLPEDFADPELDTGWVVGDDETAPPAKQHVTPHHYDPHDDHVEADRMGRLIEWLASNDLDKDSIAKALEGLPQMEELPTSTGVVMAIVGDGLKTLPLARRMAVELRVDPANVLLASSRRGHSTVPDNCRLTTPLEAQMDRRSWRRTPHPTIIALDTTFALSRNSQAWANDMLEALEPHQVIGLIEAGRKIDDIARWITLLGGVDALALSGIEETATPQAVLELGLPVARLGSRVATPDSWAELLQYQPHR